MLAPRWRAASRISSPATTSPTRRARRTFLTRRRGSRVAKDEKPQLVDYQTAERLPVIRDADWAMVLGADEFLNIHIGRGTVCDLLEAVPDSTASSSNGACSAAPDTRRGKPTSVCERFTMPAARPVSRLACRHAHRPDDMER